MFSLPGGGSVIRLLLTQGKFSTVLVLLGDKLTSPEVGWERQLQEPLKPQGQGCFQPLSRHICNSIASFPNSIAKQSARTSSIPLGYRYSYGWGLVLGQGPLENQGTFESKLGSKDMKLQVATRWYQEVQLRRDSY